MPGVTVPPSEAVYKGWRRLQMLVDGETLKSPLPVAEALRLAIQIASALEVAHKRGITHRDLKPANIMVTRAGIKVLFLQVLGWDTTD